MDSDWDSLAVAHRHQRCPKHVLGGRVQQCDEPIWQRIQNGYKRENVFVNIPYVPEYRPFAAAIIATLLKVGLRPKLASFVSRGEHRLCKICELMQVCRYCITDLSYPELQNMPFELGYSLALGRQVHSFVLIDEKFTKDRKGAKVKKFLSQISNIQGVVEPITYDKSPEKLIRELLKRIRDDIPEVIVAQKRDELVKDIMVVSEMVAEAAADDNLDEVVKYWEYELNKEKKS